MIIEMALMTVLEISINGKIKTRAGISGLGVVTAMISLMREKGKPAEMESIMFDVGGLTTDSSENREDLRWLNQPLSLGDEITLRFVDAGFCDPPKSRIKQDSNLTLESKKQYLVALKKEIEGNQ
jgi:hypothetical protein